MARPQMIAFIWFGAPKQWDYEIYALPEDRSLSLLVELSGHDPKGLYEHATKKLQPARDVWTSLYGELHLEDADYIVDMGTVDDR